VGAVIIISLLFFGDFLKAKARHLLIYIPGVKNVNIKMELANAFSSLGVMMDSGIGVSRALTLAAAVTNHPFLKALLEQSVQEVKEGRHLSEIWMESELIPAEAISLIAVGERSAKIGSVMETLGNRFLMQFKKEVSWFLTLLEPGVIIVMGIIVGGVVIAVTMGLISMNDAFL